MQFINFVVSEHCSVMLHIFRKNDELRKDAVDALCCLAHALGEDFSIFIPSIHKILQKHRLRVLHLSPGLQYSLLLWLRRLTHDCLLFCDWYMFVSSSSYLVTNIWRFQHKEFEEIEGRFRRREPLISGSTAAQRLSRRLPVEVISDPLNDVEYDPYSDGCDMLRDVKSHQVLSSLAFNFSHLLWQKEITLIPIL